MGCDWDEVLAYTTGKTVTVQHRWLGFVYYLLLFLILAVLVICLRGARAPCA